MIEARLYLVAYDVASPKRWRRVVKLVKPFCQRSQLSVFVCRSTPNRIEKLDKDLRKVMDQTADRLMILDLGNENAASSKVRAMNPLSDIGNLGASVL
jgi:CRISPR-associated protein Cas2